MFGLGLPKNTPAEIGKLDKEINASLAHTTMKARIADLGGSPMPMTSAGFGEFIADETEKSGKLIRATNIKPEQASRHRTDIPISR